MTDKDDWDKNPPAFPRAHTPGSYDFPQTGMTLRDWFAGQALAGITGSVEAMGMLEGLAKEEGMKGPLAVGALCYGMADAMLKARG